MLSEQCRQILRGSSPSLIISAILMGSGMIAPRLLVLAAVLTAGALPLAWMALIFVWPCLHLTEHSSTDSANPIMVACISMTVNCIAAVVTMIIIWEPLKLAFLEGMSL